MKEFDASTSVVAIAGLFYAASATMFLAATQTWSVHLARQAFLSCSKYALYAALGITIVEAILILLQSINDGPRWFKPGVQGAAAVATFWMAAYGLTFMYSAMKPIEVCLSDNVPTCISNAP
ncbi:hypothetical protein [Shinella sp.]|uniref:hypothetical protein n=1 Tax=Shinella sp. TaxID=1870904 RepID=UPI003D2950D4